MILSSRIGRSPTVVMPGSALPPSVGLKTVYSSDGAVRSFASKTGATAAHKLYSGFSVEAWVRVVKAHLSNQAYRALISFGGSGTNGAWMLAHRIRTDTGHFVFGLSLRNAANTGAVDTAYSSVSDFAYSTTLADNIDDSTAAITVAAAPDFVPGHGWATIGSGNPVEQIEYRRTGTALTATRGVNGTARAGTAGQAVRFMLHSRPFHVAATHDGTTVRVYVNGRLSVSNNPAAALQTYEGTISLGGLVHGSSTASDCVLGECRYWGRVLSAEEIRGRMFQRLTGRESGLIGYWPCDDASGSTVRDYAGGADLTILNPAAKLRTALR